jgi:hypothetical protein
MPNLNCKVKRFFRGTLCFFSSSGKLLGFDTETA